MTKKKKGKKKTKTIKKTLNLKINLEVDQRPARRKRIVSRRRPNLRELRRSMGGLTPANLKDPSFFGNTALLSNAAMAAMNNKAYALERQMLDSAAELNARVRAGDQTVGQLQEQVNDQQQELDYTRQQARRMPTQRGELAQTLATRTGELHAERRESRQLRARIQGLQHNVAGNEAMLREAREAAGADPAEFSHQLSSIAGTSMFAQDETAYSPTLGASSRRKASPQPESQRAGDPYALDASGRLPPQNRGPFQQARQSLAAWRSPGSGQVEALEPEPEYGSGTM
jgi:hypothetical protein